ncbi:MAG: hypothetical protein LBV74_01070 [Tannerella sp.]|jgi:hypothetical protein|nr:hypothetical protein [Tannerella sp.]
MLSNQSTLTPLVTVEKRQFHTNNEDYFPTLYDIEIEEFDQGDIGSEKIVRITEAAALLLYRYLGESLNQKGVAE